MDSAGSQAFAKVTSCDGNYRQLITTSSGSSLSGSFTLQIFGQNTIYLSFDASAAQMKLALEELNGVFGVNVHRSGPFAFNTYQWTVEFVSTAVPPQPIFADGKLLKGVNSGVTVNNNFCSSTSIAGNPVVSVSGAVGESFMAELTGSSSSRVNISYIGDGLFQGVYSVPRLGDYNLTVAKGVRGGLLGQYYSNRWLLGSPQEVRVDPVIEFYWDAEQPLIENARDYVSARWTGFVLPSFSETFEFAVTVDDGVRLWVDNDLLIDAFNNSVHQDGPVTFTAVTAKALVAGQLTSVKLEYREDTGSAACVLAWSSLSQPREVIPSYRLFSTVEEIYGSPFIISPSGRKPTPVQNVVLSIEDWDLINVNFTAPEDDGGSPITAYTVEWYDASQQNSPLDVQSLKMSHQVFGGTFLISSPAGYPYPYDIPWNVSQSDLLTIIQRLPDVDRVSVSAGDDLYSRVWYITFLTNIGYINPLTVDPRGLVSATGDKMIVCSKGLAYSNPTSSLFCNPTDSQNGTGNSLSVLQSGTVNTAPVSLAIGSDSTYFYQIYNLKQSSKISAGYGVRIFATNAEGWSSVTSVDTYLKPMSVPDAPAYVEIVRAAGSDSAIIVYWTFVDYPYDRSSAVTQFSLSWSTYSDFSVNESVTLSVGDVFCKYRNPIGSNAVLSYNLTGLTPGVQYYIAVASVNIMGVGLSQVATYVPDNTAMLAPWSKPNSILYGEVQLSSVPATDVISVLESSSQLLLTFSASESSHGAPVENYLVEFWDGSYVSQVDTLEISSPVPIRGSFKLAFANATTDYLPRDIDADSLRVALEALPSLREIQVFRSAVNGGFIWTITYLQDFPKIYAQSLSVQSKSELSANGTIKAVITTVISPVLPHGYQQVQLDAQPGIKSYSYLLQRLVTGVAYSVRVTPVNSAGLGYGMISVPSSIAPPLQKPSEPLNVNVSVASANSLTVFFMYPESDGGDRVSKYKVEWDFVPTFDSNNGLPVGYHFAIPQTSNNCTLIQCSYTISGLVKGTAYYVRVFSYNSYGYSARPGLPQNIFAVPKTQPAAPAKVYVTNTDINTVSVEIIPPVDDGGAAITHYKVEWDVVGAEAYDPQYFSDPSNYLLYSPYEVQVISSFATDYSLQGFFYVSFAGFISAPIPVSVSAKNLESILEAIPTVGDVHVSRSESIDSHGFSWSVTFLNSLWWQGDNVFDVPPLLLSNVDGTLSTGFSSKILSSATGSTFGGFNGEISVMEVVKSMAGFEQQSITVTSTIGQILGQFSLQFNGFSTPPLSVNSTEGDIASALSSLPGVGKTIVLKRNFFSTSYGFQVIVVFIETLGNLPMLSLDKSHLYTVQNSSSIHVDRQEIVVGIQPLFGSQYYNTTKIYVNGSFESPKFDIAGLLPGVNYHLRVSAWNGANFVYGNFLGSTPAVFQPAEIASNLNDITISPTSDSSLSVSWNLPVSWGSFDYYSRMINLEYDYLPNNLEVQNISVTYLSTSTGTFCLSFNGYATSPIPLDSSNLRLESALESLTSVGNVEVSVVPIMTAGRSLSKYWLVTFLDNVGDLPLLTISCDSVVGQHSFNIVEVSSGSDPTFIGGSVGIFQKPVGNLTVELVPSVQTVTVNSSSTDLNGYFYIVNSGEVSMPIDVYSSAEDMEYFLESMFTISDVTVSVFDLSLETSASVQNYGRRWIVTFNEPHLNSLLVSVGGVAADASTSAAGSSLLGTNAMVGVDRAQLESLPSKVELGLLTENQMYVVRAQVFNGVYWNDKVVSSVANKPVVTVPQAPTKVYAAVKSSSQILVWWDAPGQIGGAAVTGYSVVWDTSMGFSASSSSDFTKSCCSYVINGLSATSTYYVKVAAYNSKGYSQYSVAVPLIDWAPVFSVRATNLNPFILQLRDGYRTENTTAITATLTAAQVQSALQLLSSVRTVLVERFDQSTQNSYDPFGTTAVDVTFRVTFLDVGFPYAQSTLTAFASNLAGITVIAHGPSYNPLSGGIVMHSTLPSGPEALVMTVVSNSELGLRWNSPVFSGGLLISKFLVEWSYNSYFASLAGSSVISYQQAQSFISTANFSYQITGLLSQPVFVRVRAFGANTLGQWGGYGPAVSATPSLAGPCNVMPIHCSSTPVNMLLYLSVTPYVELSSQDVSNRLEVSFTQPKTDQFGFRTNTHPPHTPDAAASYRVSWSLVSDFSDATSVDIPTFSDDYQNVSCFSRCNFTIGVDIQNVSVVGGSSALTAGSFMLVYVGKHVRNVYVAVQQGSDLVTVLDYTVNVQPNDFLRINGDVYQVSSVIQSGLVKLTQIFAGGVNDIVNAYYAPNPGATLSVSASSSVVEAYLNSQLSSLYPAYPNLFIVSRQPVANGYSWLVTFIGEMFVDDVDNLVVVTSDVVGGLSSGSTTPFQVNGVRTYLAKTSVYKISTAGSIPTGVPLFVGVSAVNSVGVGPRLECSVSSDGTRLGTIAPRSPPGLPENVLVFAVPESLGDALRVTWEEGFVYGSAISKYVIEWSSDYGSTFTLNQVVVPQTNQKVFDVKIPTQPYSSYIVRVRAFNDQNLGNGKGPQWYQFVSSLQTTAIALVSDFSSGAQRATPTCLFGLDECSEFDSHVILSRGLPGSPALFVPTYPTIDVSRSFSKSSAVIYFKAPDVNGQNIDKFRVQWDNDPSFTSPSLLSAVVTSTSSAQANFTLYNITKLSMGQVYYIRVIVHNTGGYGAVSNVYPFKPMQQPDPPSEIVLHSSRDASSLSDYATSLNVSWSYPNANYPNPVGDGGDSVTSYLIEWSKTPFDSLVSGIQNISIPCANGSQYQRFSLSLTTSNDMTKLDKTGYS